MLSYFNYSIVTDVVFLHTHCIHGGEKIPLVSFLRDDGITSNCFTKGLLVVASLCLESHLLPPPCILGQTIGNSLPLPGPFLYSLDSDLLHELLLQDPTQTVLPL